MKYFLKVTDHPLISALVTALVLWCVGKIFMPETLDRIFLVGKSVLFYEINITVLSVGILLTFLFLVIKLVFFILRKSKPAWFEYVTDIFYGVRWCWGYTDGGSIKAYSLRAYCLKDETPLIFRRTPNSFDYTNQFLCETCGFVSDEFKEDGDDLRAKIERMIVREIRIKYEKK